MAERVFDRMKHYRKAATRHDRLDETFLANLQLILIAIYLKKTQPKTQLVQTHANTNTSTPHSGNPQVTIGRYEQFRTGFRIGR